MENCIITDGCKVLQGLVLTSRAPEDNGQRWYASDCANGLHNHNRSHATLLLTMFAWRFPNAPSQAFVVTSLSKPHSAKCAYPHYQCRLLNDHAWSFAEAIALYPNEFEMPRIQATSKVFEMEAPQSEQKQLSQKARPSSTFDSR